MAPTKPAHQDPNPLHHKRHRVGVQFPVKHKLHGKDPIIFMPKVTADFLGLKEVTKHEFGEKTVKYKTKHGVKERQIQYLKQRKSVHSYSRHCTIILNGVHDIGNKKRKTLRIPMAGGMQLVDVINQVHKSASGKVVAVREGANEVLVTALSKVSGTTGTTGE
ncbi:MAG: hypothetical protein NVS2B14_00430 [Chamaesiphon sp.]